MSEFDPSLRNALLIAGASAAFIVAGCSKSEVFADNDRFVAPGDCAPKAIYDFSIDKGDYTSIHGPENKSGEKNAIGIGYDDLPLKGVEAAPSPDPINPTEDEETARAISVGVYAGKLANPKAWFEDEVDQYLQPTSGMVFGTLESDGSYALDFDQVDEDTVSVQALICGVPSKEKLDKIRGEEKWELRDIPVNPEPPTPNNPS